MLSADLIRSNGSGAVLYLQPEMKWIQYHVSSNNNIKDGAYKALTTGISKRYSENNYIVLCVGWKDVKFPSFLFILF